MSGRKEINDMASTCICCGNKIGFFGGYKLSDEYDNPICDDYRATNK